jgi:predicted RNA-binding protein with PUA-like domain
MKAEPDSRLVNGIDVKFSIDDLAAVTEPEPWSGVRNHGAKNNMMAMREGDLAFFYHSNCKVPGIVGICEIVGEAVPDETAFEKGHPYYDEKSSRDSPTWYNVHVDFRQKFANREKVTNTELKTYKELENMQYIKQGRLSVSKVEPKEWNFIMQLAGETLRDKSIEKDWVVVSQEDAQPGAEEEDMIVDEAANAVANVVEEFAEVVAERVGEAVAEEADAETAAKIADEVAHDVAEAVTDEVVEAIREDASVAEAAQRGDSGNAFLCLDICRPN